MAQVPTITIEMGKKCAECGKAGTVPNGLCMGCTGKAFEPAARMFSTVGRAVQRRAREARAAARFER